MERRPHVRTCGGADAAERDDAVAGDPEVVVREEAAPFAAQALQQQEFSYHAAAATDSIRDGTEKRHMERKTKIAVEREHNPGDLGEGRAVEEHGRERRRHREHGHEPSLGRRHHGLPCAAAPPLVLFLLAVELRPFLPVGSEVGSRGILRSASLVAWRLLRSLAAELDRGSVGGHPVVAWIRSTQPVGSGIPAGPGCRWDVPWRVPLDRARGARPCGPG